MKQLTLPISRRIVNSSPAAAPASPTRPETVIFLDIDGVLHSLYGEDLFRDDCCSLLVSIVQATGTALVLSSSWRTEPEKIAMINAALRKWNLAPVVDRTKELDFPREVEICEWLDRHPQVHRWIALDDMDLQAGQTAHAARMRGHFVRTSPHTGLTARDAELAIQLLASQSIGPAQYSASPAVPSPPMLSSAAASPAAYWKSPTSWTTAVPPNGTSTPPATPVAADFRTPATSPINRPCAQYPEGIRTLPSSATIGGQVHAVGISPLHHATLASPAAQANAGEFTCAYSCDLGYYSHGRSIGHLLGGEQKNLDAIGCSPRTGHREVRCMAYAPRRNSTPWLIGGNSGDCPPVQLARGVQLPDVRSLDAMGCSPCCRTSLNCHNVAGVPSTPRSPMSCAFEAVDTKRHLQVSFNPPAF
mmetsp:Transcript_134487/g.335490  ORF Transcript_134487/g.335490 Transcript_134487/m.335490 type:complete len:418 (+) Transcript_134487:95-1348(+)